MEAFFGGWWFDESLMNPSKAAKQERTIPNFQVQGFRIAGVVVSGLARAGFWGRSCHRMGKGSSKHSWAGTPFSSFNTNLSELIQLPSPEPTHKPWPPDIPVYMAILAQSLTFPMLSREGLGGPLNSHFLEHKQSAWELAV